MVKSSEAVNMIGMEKGGEGKGREGRGGEDVGGRGEALFALLFEGWGTIWSLLIFIKVTNEMKWNENIHVHTNILCSHIAWLIEAGRGKHKEIYN